MGTILVNTTSAFSDGDQITSDSLNNLIDNAILNTTAVSSGTGLSVNGTTGVLSMDSSLTGKVLTGGSLNNAPIGASTPSTGAFTTLSSSSGYTGDVTGDVTGNLSGNVTGGTGSFTTLSASGDISVDGSVKQSGNTGNLTLKGGDTDGANIELYGSNHATESIRNNAYYDAGVHVFRPVDGSSSSVVITSDGEVGIGPTSPSNTLHVENTTSSGAYINYDGQSNTEFGLRIESNAAGGDFESDFANGSTALLDLYANSTSVSGGDLLVARTQSATPVLLVKGSGNVGIGTTLPSHTLDVSGEFRVNGGGTGSIVVNDEDSSLCPTMTFLRNGGGTTTNDFIKFENSGGEVAAINATGGGYFAGDVGIGISSPANSLHVVGDDQETSSINTALATSLEVSGNGTSSSSGGTILFSAASGLWKFAAIKSLVTSGSNNSIGNLAFCTRPDSTDSTLTEAMRIQYDGNVGIGDSTPSYKLDVNGTGRFVGDLTLDDELIHNLTGSGSLPGYDADGTGGTFGAVLEDGGANGSTLYMARKNSWALYLATDTNLNPQSDTGKKKVVQFADLYNQTSTQGNVVGNIAINTSSTAFNTSSDYRLKENEVDITDGIDRLKELKPYRFNFIRNPSEVVDGFFAHEVSPVVPESITGSKDAVDEDGNPDYQGIDQSKLVPLLTAALQEAVAKIEALEARVQTLEG